MASDLEQPWKNYVQQLIEKTEADADSADSDFDEPVEQKLCPGSVECSMEPHALGSTRFCAIETKIGIVFMNSSG